MKFQLMNIGILKKADIDIDGITIIAGENNVGKSTVGKALYAFLRDMSSWRKTYDDICSLRVKKFLEENSNVLEDWCMKISGAKRRRTSRVDQLQKVYSRDENFLVSIEDFQISEDANSEKEARKNLESHLIRYCHDYMALYFRDNSSIELNYEQKSVKGKDWVDDWVDRAIDGVQSLELDELKIQIQQLRQSFQEVFNSQYRKIGTLESRIVFTDDSGRKVRLTIESEGEELDQPIRIYNHIFFIESPKIYDYLSNPRSGHIQKEYLRYLMSPNIFKRGNLIPKIENNEFATDKKDSEKQLRDISERLIRIMGGRAEFLQKVGLEFKDEHIVEPIHAVNVSTGLKSIALLEYALRIGAIEEGDILILDEPEINLHPEWQLEYARTLVNLQEMFHLKILITTHSPYFMRAIECFTDINDTMDKLNVYRVIRSASEKELQVENVSYTEYGMTDLYDALSAPLEELESLLDEKYGMEE